MCTVLSGEALCAVPGPASAGPADPPACTPPRCWPPAASHASWVHPGDDSSKLCLLGGVRAVVFWLEKSGDRCCASRQNACAWSPGWAKGRSPMTLAGAVGTAFTTSMHPVAMDHPGAQVCACPCLAFHLHLPLPSPDEAGSHPFLVDAYVSVSLVYHLPEPHLAVSAVPLSRYTACSVSLARRQAHLLNWFTCRLRTVPLVTGAAQVPSPSTRYYYLRHLSKAGLSARAQ